MDKDRYSGSFSIDNLPPYFVNLILEHKQDRYRMEHEISSESNILNILKYRIREALGLTPSDDFYFNLDKNVIIDGDGLVLKFDNIPVNRVDKKPSEFKEIVKEVLEGIEKEVKQERLQTSK